MARSSLGLGVARRRVLADEVTDDLREAILSHELEPARRLGEDELALEMGVSRGPVREALMRLEREGLVTIERHRGARVSSWSKQDLEEIYSMRSVLEVLAIEWACKNATAKDIADMEAILKEYSKLSDKQRTPKEVSRIDLEFHSVLFRAAHHDRLLKIWEVLRSQIHAMLVYTWSKTQKNNKAFLPLWGPDHQKLLDSIKGKRTSEAKKEVHAHVERGFQRISKHFNE